MAMKKSNSFTMIDQGRTINALDFFVLIHMAMSSAEIPSLGWTHARTSYHKWLNELATVDMQIGKDHLEDALYAANMLNETGVYKHPHGVEFDDLLKKILRPGEIFDKITNVIKLEEVEHA